MSKIFLYVASSFIMGAFSSMTLAQNANTDIKLLDQVKARGYLKCGVSQGLPGFSNPDDEGVWRGLDVDLCRAVASATLGDASKVRYTPLSAKERFTALQSGEIDLLARNTTWTFTRDVSLGIDFTGILYFDGQGFMINKASGVKSVKELNGATICTNTGTTTELNLADYFSAHNLEYEVLSFESTDETLAAYKTGRCDVYTTDASGLAAQRLKLANPDEHLVLPEVISKEPLATAVRQGDDQWANIVRWTLYTMINADELGINSNNVDQMLTSKVPNIQRVLGAQKGLGELIGLQDNWGYQIIKQVGNYEEIFEANLGKNSPLKIERGMNALWTNGGLMYAPPIR